MGILIISFLIGLFLGIPISFSLGIATVIFIIATNVLPFNLVIETMYTSAESFPLMAIPFFVLAGELMNRTGITQRLIDFATFFLGRFRGGLSHVSVLSGATFAGLSGSSVAETAALGKTLGGAMIKQGYNREFAAALIASIGVMAPVIPPSIIIILYGSQMNVSIGQMFVGGIIPGLLIALLLMIYSYIVSVRKGYPKSEVPFSWKGLFDVSLAASLAIMMPLIIVFGIRGGIFTPTEGGAIAAAYSLIVGGVVYRTLSFKDIGESFISSGILSAVIMLVVAMSSPFGWVMSYFSLPQQFAEAMLGITESPTLILLMMIILLIFVGMFLEGAAIVMLLGPVLAPMAPLIGVNPIHFGIIVVIAIALGMITPPVGVNLFVISPIMQTSIEKISIAILPFILILIIAILIVAFVPELVLWLPSIIG